MPTRKPASMSEVSQKIVEAFDSAPRDQQEQMLDDLLVAVDALIARMQILQADEKPVIFFDN